MPNPNPDYVTKLDPEDRGTLLLVAAVGLIMCAAIALYGLLFSSEVATDPHPTPSPSPSSTWSPECTAEDLDDGACYTWDEIRDLEWHTNSPSATVTP